MRGAIVRRAEHLLGRYRWFERLHHPGAMAWIVRPTRTHWSGVQLRCWRHGEESGWLRVRVWRLSTRGIERVREAAVALDDVIDFDPVPIYWAPIHDSAATRYLVVARQEDDRGLPLKRKPLRFTWRRKASVSDARLIHSEPDAHATLPKAVLFSPATQCNLNCIHCISRHSRQSLSVANDHVWQAITDAASSGHLTHLRSDYSGDLLFSDRRHGPWLRRIEALGIPFAIDTHANDLSAEYIDRLLQSRLYFINFSLDTLDAADYPRIRRGAKPLADVLATIRAFMTRRNAERPDIETVLSFVLMRRNLASLDAAIDLAADLGVTAVIGNHLHAYTPEMADESLMLQPARYARAYDELVAKARAMGVPLGLPRPVPGRFSRRAHAPCSYPWSTAVVLGNGDVMACCVPGTKVGTLEGGQRLADVWNGESMRAFRQRVNSDHPPEACSVCPMSRLPNNMASYVPGLSEPERRRFEQRCVEAAMRGD